MRKTLDQLAAGDWVLTDSLISSRFVGFPWLVSKIAGGRVYLERYRPDHVTKAVEKTDEKYVARKSVQYVFADEASAQAASDYARDASEAYEKCLRELQMEHRKAFLAHMESMPTNAAG